MPRPVMTSPNKKSVMPLSKCLDISFACDIADPAFVSDGISQKILFSEISWILS